MAKYYVQSGKLRATLAAEDAHRAALWAVHQAMSQIAPMYDDPDLTAEQKSDNAMFEGLLLLDGKIQLSEQGFDRADAQQLDTYDIVVEWNNLMLSLDRFQKIFDRQS